MIVETIDLEALAPESVVETGKLESPAPEQRIRLDGTSVACRPRVNTISGFSWAYWTQLVVNAFPLLLADLVALAISLACAQVIASWWPSAATYELGWMLMLFVLTLPATFAVLRLYPGTGLNAVSELGQVGMGTGLMLVIFLVASSATGSGTGTALTVLVMCILLLATVPLLRRLARSIASKFHWWGQPVLFLGGGETARKLYHYYTSHRRLGIRPIAIIDDRDRHYRESLSSRTSLPNRVEALRRKHNVFWAVVSTPLSTNSAEAVRGYSAMFPYLVVVPEAEGMPIIRHQMFDCGNLPGILITNTLLLPLPRLIKSSMDFMLVAVGGALSLPIVVTIYLLIKLTSPGPATYAQQRIGKGGRPFRAWKFRTMVANADEMLQQYLEKDPELREEWERDHKLKNDPRVTAVGRWLRKTSLDELPQIWNVLRGEMSLVGPRPIVAAEISKYGNWMDLYEQATPGITGLWQISGRNNTTYEMRVALDARYVLNWTPWLDLYILARTIKVVLRREGAY